MQMDWASCFNFPALSKHIKTEEVVVVHENVSHGYVFGVKESNGDNENILTLLHDIKNQGQTPFCMTFLISSCKHDTYSILVSILTFSRSRILKLLKK